MTTAYGGMEKAEFMRNGRALFLDLLKVHSFQRKRVVLSSGKESDFFIDCKQAILTAEGQAVVGVILLEEAIDLFKDVHSWPSVTAGLAGVELGGCPLASAASLVGFTKGVAHLDVLYVRKQAKEHGTRRMIEGGSRLLKGSPVVLLEDVVTTGASTLRAVKALRDEGFTVVGVVVLVDRLEGGREAIEKEGIRVRPIYTRRDFIPEET